MSRCSTLAAGTDGRVVFGPRLANQRKKKTNMQSSILAPILGLIMWTFVIWLWMYATRIPAIRAAGLVPSRIKRKDELDVLPTSVKQIADNYNHLHEQPTVFYALALCTHLLGAADPLNVGLAWAYVGLRIVHSLIQCTSNFVPLRFAVFSLSTIVLMVVAVRDVLTLFAAA
jgi:hypothetical protein